MPVYEKEHLNQISFPLGGIGSGCIGLSGNGRLIDWEIFNRPSKGSLNGYSHIAIKATDRSGRVYAKVLQGDVCTNLAGEGFGLPNITMAGFPHFKNIAFTGEFPVATLTFSDDDFPGIVTLTAFNPFIPLDPDNSSIPAAFFKISIENNTEINYQYTVAFSLQNPYDKSCNTFVNQDGISGLFMKNEGVAEEELSYGDLSVFTDSEIFQVQPYWYRGSWQDTIVTFWNEFCANNPLHHRVYDTCGKKDMGTVCAMTDIQSQQQDTLQFVLAWNTPHCFNYWNPAQDENGKDIQWKNYYAVLFKNSLESALYSLKNFDNLLHKTMLFKDALFSCTMDESIIEAVSATISVLKSPTVMRLEDGSFYGWEGVGPTTGSCEGTCSHVWNYNYALCFLFPSLERSIRELDYRYNQFPDGHMRFRLTLPLGRKGGRDMPCVDGQMGGILRVYREWKLSGDDHWLESIWDKAKKSLEYAWHKESPYLWDINMDGVLEGRQHHTLDMELFGPSAWLQGFYLAALKAAIEISEYLGNEKDVLLYGELYEKGRAWTEENLFNGEYYIQKIDVKDYSVIQPFSCDYYWNDEVKEVKYQIADGCNIDQLCGQWHADIIGLGDIFDKNNRKKAVSSLYKNNFKPSFRNFANPWRIFALNDESGAIICDYPNETKKPSIPVPYCEEAMHGFEYELAGLLMSHNEYEKGLDIVRSIRSRYNGKNRNPWNEIECGNNYARSLASYALIPLLSGFLFDMPNKRIGFDPKINPAAFKSIWSVEQAWGSVEINKTDLQLTILGGTLPIRKFHLPFADKILSVWIDDCAVDFSENGNTLLFDERMVYHSVKIYFERH